MHSRLPTILGKAIEDAQRTLNEQYDEDRIKDLAACIRRMENLMSDMRNDRVLRDIVDDGEADVVLWNKAIATYFPSSSFMNATWVFAEAYKYRRLHECFSVSKYWKEYDVFFRQKVCPFVSSFDYASILINLYV